METVAAIVILAVAIPPMLNDAILASADAAEGTSEEEALRRLGMVDPGRPQQDALSERFPSHRPPESAMEDGSQRV